VVCLDFSKKEIHYFKRQKRYARGSSGFVCRVGARSNGYRRSLLGFRSAGLRKGARFAGFKRIGQVVARSHDPSSTLERWPVSACRLD